MFSEILVLFKRWQKGQGAYRESLPKAFYKSAHSKPEPRPFNRITVNFVSDVLLSVVPYWQVCVQNVLKFLVQMRVLSSYLIAPHNKQYKIKTKCHTLVSELR